MVELGLYGVARVYWSVFGAALGHRAAITGVFLALGLLTAVTGALFCFRERHIKRLLAFSTISHAGMFLAGIALLTPLGLAGVAVYVAGHALLKAALFLCTGIVLHRLGSVNESWLHGRGPAPAGHRRGVHRRRARPGRPAAVRHVPGQGLDRGQRRRPRPDLDHRRARSSARCWSAAPCCGWRAESSTAWATRPAEDPQMAGEASEEKSETDRGKRPHAAVHDHPRRRAGRGALVIGVLAAACCRAWTAPSRPAAVRFQDQAGLQRRGAGRAGTAHPAALLPAGGTGTTAADVAIGAARRRPRWCWPGCRCTGGGCRCCAGAPSRPGLAGPVRALPERRHQRLRDLDRRRHSGRGRHPRTPDGDRAAAWSSRRRRGRWAAPVSRSSCCRGARTGPS